MPAIKQSWRDSVWSKVVAGGVLVLIGTYYLDWWPALGHTFGRVTEYLGKTSTLPNWLLGILWMSFAGLVASVTVFVWIVLVAKTDTPNWLGYTSDVFLGVRWQWRYGGAIDEITGLCLFCPECDHQIFLKDTAPSGTLVQCDKCRRRLGAFEEPPAALETRIKRLIQQKIQDGAWAAPTST